VELRPKQALLCLKKRKIAGCEQSYPWEFLRWAAQDDVRLVFVDENARKTSDTSSTPFWYNPKEKNEEQCPVEPRPKKCQDSGLERLPAGMERLPAGIVENVRFIPYTYGDWKRHWHIHNWNMSKIDKNLIKEKLLFHRGLIVSIHIRDSNYQILRGYGGGLLGREKTEKGQFEHLNLRGTQSDRDIKDENKRWHSHAMVLVGYGVRKEPPHLEYWLILNSWNETWGENGYARVEMVHGWKLLQMNDVMYPVLRDDPRVVDVLEQL